MTDSSSNPSSPESNNGEAEDCGNNSILAKIMKMKQERLRKLQECNEELKEELTPVKLDIQHIPKKKSLIQKAKKKSETLSTPTRRSLRISSKIEEEPPKLIEYEKAVIVRPDNCYGPMPGIEVGHHWETRMECSYDGVHRPTVAGIHGGPKGAYSIALSGGYPEDVDEGHSFTYTGAGGRDLKGTAMKPKNLRTAPQTKNQELEGVNYSLVRSIETGNPVRVIRGYKSDSVFAPETGYRYDGLYKVVKYWEDFGKTGFRIYRFKMVRMSNQAPAPWEQSAKPRKPKSVKNENTDPLHSEKEHLSDDSSSPNRVDTSKISVEVENEDDLDKEIKICSDKLSHSSGLNSQLCESLKNDSADSLFAGWDDQ